jgi:hypothetical protein
VITKKKLKTKLDYEIRTFGFCALLLLIFTVIFVNPQITDMNNANAALEQEIRVEEENKSRLMFEQEEIMTETTIKNND